jgi:hypothetical protein
MYLSVSRMVITSLFLAFGVKVLCIFKLHVVDHLYITLFVLVSEVERGVETNQRLNTIVIFYIHFSASPLSTRH